MGQAPAWKEGEEYGERLERRLLSRGLRVRPMAAGEDLERLALLALRGTLLRSPGRTAEEVLPEIRQNLQEAAARGALLVAEEDADDRLAGFLLEREDGTYLVHEDSGFRRRGVATLLVDTAQTWHGGHRHGLDAT